jgi:anti-sigma B factor antagonist
MSLTRPLAPVPASSSAEVSDLCVSVHPDVPPVVELSGEIDVQSAPWLRDELLRIVRRHGPWLAVDLGEVTFLDCAGINVLLATRRRARLEGGWIRVVRSSPRAWRVISLLGLQDVLAGPELAGRTVNLDGTEPPACA